MKRPKQFTTRDLNVELRFPTISWSSLNAFMEYDKETWYRSYVLGERSKPNPQMQAGIDVGDRIVSDPLFLPSIERPEIYEHNLVGRIGGIKITGHLDGWSPKVPGICEYKTSQNSLRWTQQKVDDWGQLTLYCLLVYLHYKIKPEKLRLRLYSIPVVSKGDFSVVQEGKPTVFTTQRTLMDVLNFGILIKRIHREMEQFIESYPHPTV